ncbi:MULTISPECIES: hypothetical protein [Cyanophyceae]|uniref:hypothetical protein n=1 Tax=Cyanophyceae TaxID=3028117 RepID=UPI001684DAA5|nr:MULTISPECIES: hypothetical protein [Cyanophyceae]MBD1916285.1 hypothetical protein [Phormidium sp. FACHB-77]MBD2028411.1 hypothetical protein [Phormidium sp. FACHB-322]MBD2051890.1 hypothetical protein [Leptolyngbya sp. FACHB-60]
MNTPSHLILNLALLRRPVTPAMTWPILIGALIPDAAMFVFYGWARWQGLPEQTIWGEAYYSQPWQAIFAVGNSMPLGLLGVAIGYSLRRSWFGPSLGFLGASMVLHHLADLPLHHDDAHQHFWPLSSVRFISPVSYWDVDHLGRLGATIELVLVLIASAYLLPRLSSRFSQALLGVTVALTAVAYSALVLVPLI